MNKTTLKKKINLSSAEDGKDVSVMNQNASSSDIEEIKKDLAEIKTLIKGFKKDLKGLVEIQQRLVHERLGVPIPPSPKEYGEEPSASKTKAKIDIVSIEDDRIRVSGNTFDFKTAIKDSGPAKWEQGSKSWSLPSDCLDKLVQNFENLNLVKDTDFSVNVKNLKNNKNTGDIKETEEVEETNYVEDAICEFDD